MSDFARCFAIFGLNLIDSELLKDRYFRDNLSDKLISSLYRSGEYYKNSLYDKPHLQFLCFTLSALEILGHANDKSIVKYVSSLRSFKFKDIEEYYKINTGRPPSGNMAMFHAVINLYLIRNKINMNENSIFIEDWLNYHKKNINKFGFWGNESGFCKYRNFQNGYHQWEIFSYLEEYPSGLSNAALVVASLQDKYGHFSPYPGGGGCYDYDAAYILLTHRKIYSDYTYDQHLKLLLDALIKEQNEDGGFCETKSFITNGKLNYKNILGHIPSTQFGVSFERFIEILKRTRYKHRNIHTHWSLYSRDWNESNLWDAWFRVLTIMRISHELGLIKNINFRSISFPGIGHF